MKRHRPKAINLAKTWAAAMSTLALAMTLAIITAQAQAQTFSVSHTFTGGQDGRSPDAGLTIDRGGNLYGTTYAGGTGAACAFGCGTVFKVSHKGTGWIFSPLYSFTGGNDGLRL